MPSSTTKKREKKKKKMNTLNIYIVINMRVHIHIESIGCEKTIHVYIQRSDEEKRETSQCNIIVHAESFLSLDSFSLLSD
jgi:hypothetical protein